MANFQIQIRFRPMRQSVICGVSASYAYVGCYAKNRATLATIAEAEGRQITADYDETTNF